MLSPSDILKGRARLVPFFKAVCMYFLAGGNASLTGVALKVAPVLSLLMFVLLRAYAPATSKHQKRYALLVTSGLALSVAGDALLVWPQGLEGGMAAFAAAHVCYLTAFGLRPAALRWAVPLLVGGTLYVREVPAPPHLSVPVTLYALVLGAMAWRGAARSGPQRIGALMFVVSDALLGYTLFVGTLPHQRLLVMSTYYVAQCCIALSALEQPREPVH